MPSIAEEGGYGKVKLWEKGAYKEMDVCLMSVTRLLEHHCFLVDPRPLQVPPRTWTPSLIQLEQLPCGHTSGDRIQGLRVPSAEVFSSELISNSWLEAPTPHRVLGRQECARCICSGVCEHFFTSPAN
jgi:hypothetical protein